MSKEKADDEIPSGCASPARLEKTDSSSSRQSASPDHWDSEPWDRTARIRPSSWDDSDDDSSPKPETAGSQPSRIYSSESKEFKGSISSEINELKKQFFASLEKENVSSNDKLRLEKLKEKLEMKLKCDRRHSPARVRRRSKSSSSSSPVQEIQKSPETREKSIGPALELVESDSPSPRALEIDTRYYLNNFFSELRSKRISMLDPVSVTDKIGKDDVLICDNMKLEMLNELNAPDLNDDGGYFCKTSRKLSQILEVEETRKELEKSSEDSLPKTELLTTDMRTAELKSETPPIQTARSRRSEKVLQAGDGRQRKREGYKSLSFEEFGNLEKVGRTSRGSLSERSARIFGPKLDEDFIHLCAKTGKLRLNSPKTTKDPEVEKSFQFLCLADALGANQAFSAEPPSRAGDENPNKATAPGSPTSVKSTDRSERSRTARTKSAQSRTRSDPHSPRFALSIGGDSARSLQLDEVNSSHSQTKDEETKTVPRSKRSREEFSTKNSNKSSFRSESTYESKTDKNLHITLESPSVESVKSSGSLSEHRNTSNYSRSRPSTRRSQRTGRDSNRASNTEPTPRVQNLILDICGNSPVDSNTSLKEKSHSFRSELSKKTPDSARTLEDGLSSRASDPRTPRSHKIPKLGLPLDVMERPESQNTFCPSPRTAESENSAKNIYPLQNSNPPSLGSRSGRFRKSTSRSRSATPKTSSSNSVRFREEEKPTIILPEDSLYNTLSNHTPNSAATRKSSYREIDPPSQRPSTRSENSAMRTTFTPKLDNTFEESPLGSGKSPMRSSDKNSPGSAGNISPSKSEQTKSRPASWTSVESKSTDVPPEIEKLDMDVGSGRTTNRSTTTEEYEEKEEHRLTPRSRSGADSDRQSNQRLSIINEVTFEDFETSTTSIEKEEKDLWGKSRPPSRRSRRGVSPESVRTISKDSPRESFTGKPPGESSPRKNPRTSDGGSWSELIETFEGGQDSSLFSEKNFPGFRSQKEGNSVTLSVYPSTMETLEGIYDGSDDMKDDSFELSRKIRSPGSEKEEILEQQQQCEEDFGFSLVGRDSSLIQKVKAKEDGPPPSPQNLYFVDVDKGGPFGIGEFGDITWWSGGKPNSEDLDKPKDHGDGIHSLRSSEILLMKAEKREKEMKNQRQLWTELKEDFRDSKLFSNYRLPKVQTDPVYNRFIPVALKTSKSDNCIDRRLKDGSDSQSLGIYEFPNENNKRDNMQNKLLENSKRRSTKSSSRNMAGSGSMASTREDSEFDCEKTPRLSRSMSDLTTQLPLEKYESNEFSESRNSSRAELFEKADSRNEEEDSVNLDIFLARQNKPETGVKSNNWLHLKSQEGKKSGKKAKTKMKEGLSLSRESYIECLLKRFPRNPRLDQLIISPENLIPTVSFCEEKNRYGGNEADDDSTFLFTSESVGEGHPDKMCDQISDAILDAHLRQDPDARVACETVTKTGMILVSGEITSKAVVDYQNIVRKTVRQIGYDDSSKGFDCSTCCVMLMIDEQSSEIAAGVHLNKTDEEIGAGDQGFMFGYATDETDECMPLTIVLAHRLNQKMAELRRNQQFWWALPDSKTQVTCEYSLHGGACIPKRVHTVVVSLQHSENIPLEELRSQVLLKVIKEVIPDKYLDSRTIFHINPCGVFLIGGPKGDAGLTGRKTIVDTYGGWGAHGGGSFSGKDFTKVDRSAAYACRWVAKSLVKAGLCRRCLVQVSYAIGVAEPVSVSFFDYGTSKLSRKKIMEIVKENFDLRPGKIATELNLRTPLYQKTSIYGHFGRCCFPWEQPKALSCLPDSPFKSSLSSTGIF